MSIEKTFTRYAEKTSQWAGHSSSFIMALSIIVLWLLTGPIFGYSDTWQLIINTGTTIVTFLMVFLIQNTQNREAKATQLKLDELIRSTEGAHNILLDLEELEEVQLEKIRQKYLQLARAAREGKLKGESDSHHPDILLD